MTAHILIVDDDPGVLSFIETYLGEQGFEVSTATNGEGLRRQMAEKPIDLVILDLILPGEDGIALATHIRRESDLPIIMLTGRGDTIDRIIGLEVGADDYLTKPFDPRELLARINSVLRRTSTAGKRSQEQEKTGNVVRFAGWRLDTGQRHLLSPEGNAVALTGGEFDLLLVFVKNTGRVLSRDQLLDMARGREAFSFDRSIDVHVSRIRRKIEADPQHPVLIKTVRAAGYMFTPDVDWE